MVCELYIFCKIRKILNFLWSGWFSGYVDSWLGGAGEGERPGKFCGEASLQLSLKWEHKLTMGTKQRKSWGVHYLSYRQCGVVGSSRGGLGQTCVLGSSRWARLPFERLAEIQTHSAYSLLQSTRPHMEMRLLWHGLPGTTRLLENISVRIDHVVAGNQQRSRQVWLWEVDKQGSVGNLQPRLPQLPLQLFPGLLCHRGWPGLQAGPSYRRTHSSAAPGLCSMTLSHTLDSTHLQPKQTLFTSQVGFKFCSFCSCFSFRFLAGSSSTGNFNTEIEGREYSL